MCKHGIEYVKGLEEGPLFHKHTGLYKAVAHLLQERRRQVSGFTTIARNPSAVRYPCSYLAREALHFVARRSAIPFCFYRLTSQTKRGRFVYSFSFILLQQHSHHFFLFVLSAKAPIREPYLVRFCPAYHMGELRPMTV